MQRGSGPRPSAPGASEAREGEEGETGCIEDSDDWTALSAKALSLLLPLRNSQCGTTIWKKLETAQVVRKSCKYHVQETYFVWSLVSEIYGKEKGGEVTHYFLARTRDLLAVGISKSKFV